MTGEAHTSTLKGEQLLQVRRVRTWSSCGVRASRCLGAQSGRNFPQVPVPFRFFASSSVGRATKGMVSCGRIPMQIRGSGGKVIMNRAVLGRLRLR